ncbi:MAG: nuclear transport factor 2 family protein [Proteobacteria bacterium]|nr:nuclear transport factor 2 family protein [Pseudomonadota bacterium]
MGTLEERIQALEDRDEIRELTARYCHAVVRKDGPALAGMFCEDGEMRMGETVMRGREELLDGYSGPALTDIAPKPFIQNHVIELDGDRASGLCSAELRLVQDGEAYTAAGHYEDEYRRVDGTWKFASRNFVVYHWVPLSRGWA